MITAFPKYRLKYIATINEESLPETTPPDYELQYLDIGNVTSTGEILDVTPYTFDKAPSRARRQVRHGDVIISTVRTYLLAIAAIEHPADNLIVSTGFAVIRPMPAVLLPRFCKYLLREASFIAEVQRRSVGVSYPAVNATDLGNIFVPLPTLAQQEVIADFLDHELQRLGQLAEARQQQLALLEKKRRAIIAQAVTQGLNTKAPYRDSGFSWFDSIPAHWQVVRLKYLAKEKLSYGANEAAEEENYEHPRFVRITDIDENGNLREETFRSLAPDVAEPYLLKEGDILFARSGATVGKTFIYRQTWGIACFAGYLIRMSCNKQKILPDFMYQFAQSSAYWSQIEEGAIQATIPNFSAEKYADIVVPLPSLIEQEEIITYLSTKLLKISALRNSIENSLDLLQQKRSSLITAGVMGQLIH